MQCRATVTQIEEQRIQVQPEIKRKRRKTQQQNSQCR